MDDIRLGSVLLESKVISESDLEKCLEVQALTGNTRTVGQILLEQGRIDRATLERLLQMQEARRVTRDVPQPVAADSMGNGILEAAARAGARELVVSEGRPVMVRESAAWRPLTAEAVRSPEVWDFVRREMGSEVLEELADRKFVVRDLVRPGLCRGRITAMRHTDGVAVMVELRPEATATLAELGVPEAVGSLLGCARGLVLFVGERGEGRSETLASVLAAMAVEPGRYVVALDDALDAPTPVGGALVTRRRVGDHVGDYAAALRTTLREDPDAILLGSVDDPDTFDLAVRAAEGGRLVVGWMNASSVAACLSRALRYYTALDAQRLRQSLANVLRAVCVRHLVPNKRGDRMTPVVEWMVADDAARDVLRRGELDSLTMLIRAEGNPNGASLDQRLFRLAKDGEIRVEDAYARAEDKAWLLDRLGSSHSEGASL